MAFPRIPSPLAALVAGTLLAGASRAEDVAGLRWPEVGGRAEIARPFKGLPIRIGVSSRTAGAIDSLTWNGRQFVNSFDHGRELQSASSFNQWGECFNPTEAGSSQDAAGPTSTSRLLSLNIGEGRLETRSEMAFWLEPGETSPGCPNITARNRQARSNHTLAKTVTIGARGVPNAIEHAVVFGIPDAYGSAVFEALTAYMPAAFSQFWSFDPAAGLRAPLSDTQAEQGLPVILSTPDGAYAMGVYSPALPQEGFPNLGYGRFRFDKLQGPGNATVKWNCVFRAADLRPGEYRYSCFSLVGTLADVEAGMRALHAATRPR